jgi:proteasome lid subunit RPN8/RPN11
MMKLLLPLEIQDVLVRELRAEGRRECGGILFGKHVGENLFQIAGITKQKGGGTNSHFIRDPTQHADQLDQFFRERSEDCSRFNYLGEWHSHPSFEVAPSSADLLSMSELVCDPSVGVNFAVLLIARLERPCDLNFSATLCQPPEQFSPISMFIEASRTVTRKRFRLL